MNTKATLSDYVRRRNEIRQMYPDDLLEDLKEEEPTLYGEALSCDVFIANYNRSLESSVSPIALLPSILTKGWNQEKRNPFCKNWADMENLLKLYAIGLYFKDRPLTYQSEHDKKELSDAIKLASISSKNKKGISPEERLKNAKTYLLFGMNTLNIFFMPDSAKKSFDMSALDTEIHETTNDFNAEKLRRSKNIALRVGRMICDRYKN